ncbi:MAG TPA: hypothetical protein VJG85_02225 [Patescibacteria group bacterium]|nr:hypothetical protein [Patescibacteria group bacterium]
MKKYLVIFFVNIVLVLFQNSFLFVFLGGEANPNLILAFAFSLLLLDKSEEALFSAFVGGLLIDLLGFTMPGLSSLVFLLAIYIGLFIKKYLFKSWVLQLIVLMLSTYLGKQYLGPHPEFGTFRLLSGLLLTAGMVFAFYPLNKYLFTRLFVSRKFLEIERI